MVSYVRYMSLALSEVSHELSAVARYEHLETVFGSLSAVKYTSISIPSMIVNNISTTENLLYLCGKSKYLMRYKVNNM